MPPWSARDTRSCRCSADQWSWRARQVELHRYIWYIWYISDIYLIYIWYISDISAIHLPYLWHFATLATGRGRFLVAATNISPGTTIHHICSCIMCFCTGECIAEETSFASVLDAQFCPLYCNLCSGRWLVFWVVCLTLQPMFSGHLVNQPLQSMFSQPIKPCSAPAPHPVPCPKCATARFSHPSCYHIV